MLLPSTRASQKGAILHPIHFPANVPGKATEDDPSPWALAFMCKIQKQKLKKTKTKTRKQTNKKTLFSS